ncbi:MAG: tyrosine-type recombinase/integrase, partial [Ardenticatenales bacterium]|nr:tyrosine-type recombinase/integrase [Ardenticatenales bacterium]
MERRDEALFGEPAAWAGVTWGLVQGFVAWLLAEGYAVGSINVHLATVRSYARLAAQAGAIPAQELGLIQSVRGYGRKQGRNLDAQRTVTCVGHKKVEAVRITDEVARALKSQADTPQERRDALLMSLLLDHGLRVGEVAELCVGDIDVAAGRMRFYRRKVDQTQVHKLTADTLRAATAYLTRDGAGAPDRPLLQGSRKSGTLSGQMSMRAIRERVRVLGEGVGVVG